MEPITVIGAGLAGCEAACQIAKRGGRVTLYEMKPEVYSPAHTSPFFAELVCSNSLKTMGSILHWFSIKGLTFCSPTAILPFS